MEECFRKVYSTKKGSIDQVIFILTRVCYNISFLSPSLMVDNYFISKSTIID